MALLLPGNFEKDIQGRDTQLFPIVVIGGFEDSAWNEESNKEWIVGSNVISTNSFSYSYDDNQRTTVNTTPILLNIPSFKESIDLEKRNYKISNINISISNAPYNGQRFSDSLDNPMNQECRVYWWSPQTEYIYAVDHPTFATADFRDEMAFQAYYGVIRRYDISGDKVKLVIEDKSQANLHADLPKEYFTDPNVPSKNLNKPKPMVYGNVDKSPLFITKAELTDDVNTVKKLLMDSDDSTTLQNEGTYNYSDEVFLYNYRLYIYEDGYLPLNRYQNQHSSGEASEVRNWDIVKNIINFEGTSNELRQGILHSWVRADITSVRYFSNHNDANNGQIGVVNVATGELWYPGSTGAEPDWMGATGTNPGSYIRFQGGYQTKLANSSDISPYAGLRYRVNLKTGFDTVQIDGVDQPATLNYLILNIEDKAIDDDDADSAPWYWGIQSDVENFGVTLHGVSSSPSLYEIHSPFQNAPTSGIINNFSTTNEHLRVYPMYGHSGNAHLSPAASPISILADAPTEYQIWLPALYYKLNSPEPNFDLDILIDLQIISLMVWQDIAIDDLYNRDYYADVAGRKTSDNTVAQTAKEIIGDIFERELGKSLPDASFNTEQNYNWIYGFTVDKKINSKKLIENICSVSPYIAQFDNMGNFKFNVIPDMHTPITSKHTIDRDNVIDFSFSRTPIEQVYTKVDLRYKWDYGAGDFSGKRSIDVDQFTCEDVGGGGNAYTYNYDYYGFDRLDNYSGDHTNTTLLIDDDRGKMIRKDDTAEKFITWMLSWHMNQHLKMKIRLPLSYLYLEIGEFLEIDKLIVDLKPYGIDYTKETQTIAGYQTFYPVFMITDTNKTLEYVEISCIQLHELWNTAAHTANMVVNSEGEILSTGYFSDVGCSDAIGCTDLNACNYDEYATADDGSCVYPGPGCAGEGCPTTQVFGYDCNGNCLDGYEMDTCANCLEGGSTHEDWNSCCDYIDCAGVCEGPALEDCNGVCGGSAYLDPRGNMDACPSGHCVGGDTGLTECEMDCTGYWNGNTVHDCTGTCGGDAVHDCANVCGGDAGFDDCGVCDGDNSTCGVTFQLAAWGILTGDLVQVGGGNGPTFGLQTGKSFGAGGSSNLPTGMGSYWLTTPIPDSYFILPNLGRCIGINSIAYCAEEAEDYNQCVAGMQENAAHWFIGGQDDQHSNLVDLDISQLDSNKSRAYFLIKVGGPDLEAVMESQAYFRGKINFFIEREVTLHSDNNLDMDWVSTVEPLLGNYAGGGEASIEPYQFDFEMRLDSYNPIDGSSYLYIVPKVCTIDGYHTRIACEDAGGSWETDIWERDLFFLKDFELLTGTIGSFNNENEYTIRFPRLHIWLSDITQYHQSGTPDDASTISILDPEMLDNSMECNDFGCEVVEGDTTPFCPPAINIHMYPPGTGTGAGGCGNPADINNDGNFNVIDIVALANCVIGPGCDPCNDMTGDGTVNVLDVVGLANCVLAQSCG